MNNLFTSEMLSALTNADSVMVCAHVNPDGDAIGSLLAAGRLLKRMGKRCTLVSHDGVPSRFQNLCGADGVIMPDQLPKDIRFDAALAVDVSEMHRMGDAQAAFAAAKVNMQIDHHPTNPLFARFNAVDPEAAATGELILDLWEALGEQPDAEAAALLYGAISSDTGNFCFNNVRAYTFDCMRRLMDCGLDISAAARRLYLTRQRPHVALLARALASMEYFADGKATCMHLSQADLDACGAKREHVDRIVNYGLEIEGVCMTFLAYETPEGWKYSLRALPPYHVNDIAARFGGGGHVLAAGCMAPGAYEDSARVIQKAMEAQLNA